LAARLAPLHIELPLYPRYLQKSVGALATELADGVGRAILQVARPVAPRFPMPIVEHDEKSVVIEPRPVLLHERSELSGSARARLPLVSQKPLEREASSLLLDGAHAVPEHEVARGERGDLVAR